MRRLLLLSLLPACAALSAAEVAATNEVEGVRNPFWPIGYEGEREVISAEKRLRPKKKQKPAAPAGVQSGHQSAAAEKAAKEAAAKAAAEKAAKEAAERAEAERKKREITAEHWKAARAALKIGGRMKMREGGKIQNTSIIINGKVYSDGDKVSIVHDSRRFTWQVGGLTDSNTLKLRVVGAMYIEKSGNSGKKSDKGDNP